MNYSISERPMPCDKHSAVSFAERHAEPHSTRNCAQYVRRAIEWGGVPLRRSLYAKDYDRILEAAKFYTISGAPQKGDVAVIQPPPGRIEGHMAIYNGTIWISDFKQRPGPDGFYPGETYRKARPSYKIYRHD